MRPYAQSPEHVFRDVKSSPQGLTGAEAQRRLQTYGPNRVEEAPRPGFFRILLKQFASPLVWILLVAVALSALLKEWVDVGVIGGIVLANAIIGTSTELRAEEAIAHLKKFLAPHAKVIRDGREQEISAEQLVPGDILLLATGDKVTADARLFEVVNMHTQEAVLTGESVPVRKDPKLLPEDTPLAERKNMSFTGTIITAGHAKAIVFATGMNTEIGHIAKLIQKAEPPPTPLQLQLQNLAKVLTIAVIVIAVAIFGLGIGVGRSWFEMFKIAIALAVAVIPEGLPAVVTIALAIGVRRMTRKNALVRHLPSVETLGACTVICSDKTGTLTHNEMTVRALWFQGQNINVTGSGYDPEGSFTDKPKDIDLLLRIGALNNDAKIHQENDRWIALGDPTEAALIVSAQKAGMDPGELNERYPRIGEIEFTSESKCMTTAHRTPKGTTITLKGAPEVVLDKCTRALWHGRVVRLTPALRKQALAAAESFAEKALRVLGFAYKSVTAEQQQAKWEHDLIFIGLQAMIDPPRPEVGDAIKQCETAGIKVIMVTGDHLTTAKAIAKELGITGNAMTGKELDHLNHTRLEGVVEEIGVFARVEPRHKIAIVDALKAKGHVVAMTGDGVNDAPALRKADIGISMGITGTDVAKEASEMVLADDNFASIVGAVEEGRVIFDNIKKFVEYLLSSNLGELLVVVVGMILGAFLGLPLPVLALQLLWINLITDGLPALSLGIEPPEPKIMSRKPLKVEEKILSKKRGLRMFLIGAVMLIGTIGVFFSAEPQTTENIPHAQTLAFTTLVLFQMFNALNLRSEKLSLFKIGLFSNPKLWGAIAISVVMQIVVVHTPFMNLLFDTIPLTLVDWLICTAIAASVLVIGELLKLFASR